MTDQSVMVFDSGAAYTRGTLTGLLATQPRICPSSGASTIHGVRVPRLRKETP
jgi:hypothetical protein